MPTISPSIHEAVIARHLVRDVDGDAVPDPAMSALHDAVRQARAAAERAGRAAETVLRDGSTPVVARQRSARDAAWSGAAPGRGRSARSWPAPRPRWRAPAAPRGRARRRPPEATNRCRRVYLAGSPGRRGATRAVLGWPTILPGIYPGPVQPRAS